MVTIHQWSSLSPYFTPEEIFSPDTIRTPHMLDVSAIIALNDGRHELGIPILVNFNGLRLRGVRSAREQISLKEAGGAENSQHVQGKAFDCSFDLNKISYERFESVMRSCGFNFFKVYPDKGFIHMDHRNLIII